MELRGRAPQPNPDGRREYSDVQRDAILRANAIPPVEPIEHTSDMFDSAVRSLDFLPIEGNTRASLLTLAEVTSLASKQLVEIGAGDQAQEIRFSALQVILAVTNPILFPESAEEQPQTEMSEAEWLIHLANDPSYVE